MPGFCRFTVVLGALLGTIAEASGSIEALDELRWESRILLIFAPAERDSRVTALEAAIGGFACAIRERHLLIGRVFGVADGRIGNRMLASAEVAALRDRFQVEEAGFRVFLIGKDGGIKARYDRPPQLDAVFGRIDGMPMRQQERRRQVAGCQEENTCATC